MSKEKCGHRGRLGDCSKGPKKRHICGEKNVRAGGSVHVQHYCKHCGEAF